MEEAEKAEGEAEGEAEKAEDGVEDGVMARRRVDAPCWRRAAPPTRFPRQTAHRHGVVRITSPLDVPPNDWGQERCMELPPVGEKKKRRFESNRPRWFIPGVLYTDVVDRSTCAFSTGARPGVHSFIIMASHSATQKLASLATQARKVADPLYARLRAETVKSYEQMMAANKEYVVADAVAADKLAKQWFYTKMSQIPGGIKTSAAELGVLKGKLGGWKELSAQEMGVLVAFGAELFAWFSIGEIVGRGGSITGYDI